MELCVEWMQKAERSYFIRRFGVKEAIFFFTVVCYNIYCSLQYYDFSLE